MEESVLVMEFPGSAPSRPKYNNSTVHRRRLGAPGFPNLGEAYNRQSCGGGTGVVRLVSRNPGGSIAPPSAHQVPQPKDVAERELNVVRTFLPTYRKCVGGAIQHLAKNVFEKPPRSRRMSVHLPEVFGTHNINPDLLDELIRGDSGIPLKAYSADDIDGPVDDSVRSITEHTLLGLFVRLTGPATYDIWAGPSGYLYASKAKDHWLVDPAILDDPGYWDRAWERWRDRVLADPNRYFTQVDRDMRLLRVAIEELCPSYFDFDVAIPFGLAVSILRPLSERIPAPPHRIPPSLHCVHVPDSAIGTTLSLSWRDPEHGRDSWTVHWRSWDRFLDPPRWRKCFDRWSGLHTADGAPLR